MIPKLLKERSDYENSLIDVPLQNCTISKVTDREILFENLKTGETYYGQIYYQNRETSALINILMKTVLRYAGWEVYSLDDTMNILNHLQGERLSNYIQYPLYLRIDSNNEIYGIIGKNFNETNKEYIYNFIYKKLQEQYDNITIKEVINKYNKVQIFFYDKLGRVFTAIFGNDTGHSRYDFINEKLNVKDNWDHNMNLDSFYEIIDYVLGNDYISNLELTEMKNFNMN